MEKGRDWDFPTRKKVLKRWKAMWLGVLAWLLVVPSSAMAQEKRVTLDIRQRSMLEIVGELRRAFDYQFLYKVEDLEAYPKRDLVVKDAGVEEVMDALLKDTRLTWRLENGVILIKRQEQRATLLEPVKVEGVVRDKNKAALPGVTVVLKGLSVGTATDAEGHYELYVPDTTNAVLVFSFVGLETVERKVTGPEEGLVVVMEETTEALAEVVKTGYYSTTKRRASGSIAVVTKESLESKIPATIDNLLQGMVAGVAVTNVGRPGASSKIKIRGTNSIDGSTDPLWVVDGVPLQDDLPEIDAEEIKSGNFNEIFMNGVAGINPADIDNITILKDAAASAIYGSRAAGGVIVITTKQGQSGRTRVNYSARFGVGLRPQRDNDLMNTEEKLAWEEELWQEFGAEKLASGSPQVPVVGIVGMLNMDRLGKNGVMWTDTEDFEPMTQAEKATPCSIARAMRSRTAGSWAARAAVSPHRMTVTFSHQPRTKLLTAYISTILSKTVGSALVHKICR